LQKLQAIFLSLTVVVDILLAWIEVMNVMGSDCKKEPFNVAYFCVRFSFFLLSRFYLLSAWNIELLSKTPYNSTEVLTKT